MPKPKTVAAGYQPITIRIPLHIYDEARAIAEEEDRSLNEQMVRIVKLWYADLTKQRQGEPSPCPTCHPAPVAVAE